MSASGRRGQGRAPGDYSDGEVDYLLSGGSLPGGQRAAIFTRAVRTLRRRQRWARVRRMLGARWARPFGAVVAATAACLIVWSWRAAPSASFRAKGIATNATAAAIDVECLRATLAACPRGSILAFSVRGVTNEGFMTAYLQSKTSANRIWLLFNEPTLARAPGGGDLLASGGRIPDGLGPGDYTVEALLTRRLLSREQALTVSPIEIVARAQFVATVPP